MIIIIIIIIIIIDQHLDKNALIEGSRETPK